MAGVLKKLLDRARGALDIKNIALVGRARLAALENGMRLNEYFATTYRWRCEALRHELWGSPSPHPAPPARIPDDLVSRFTLDGRVELIKGPIHDDTRAANHPLIYTDAEIDDYLARIKAGRTFVYGETDLWLRAALTAYPIAGQAVAIMGSLSPWYEATCLHFGAQPTTIEYNRIIVKSDRIKAVTVEAFRKSPVVFDAALSVSSFEHDGLGRYGDPLDPEGDLKAMVTMRSIVKRRGLLYLSVPVGRDRILFNDCRVYGRIRLPLLLEGWTMVATFGLDKGALDHPGSKEPIYVLRNE